MPEKSEQIERELAELKEEVSTLKKQESPPIESSDLPALMKYMIEEREKTNKMLAQITAKVEKLEKELEDSYDDEEDYPEVINNRPQELVLSGLDSRILEFVQSRGMVCADDLREFMGYRGRNAACTRLNRLYGMGLLYRHQLGHKVYYKYDAGKTTNTLIISPPQ